MKMRLTINTFDLASTERLLCCEALTAAGSIVEAAKLLGITRHALKRRIVKHEIEWPRPKFGPNSLAAAQADQAARLAQTTPAPSPAPQVKHVTMRPTIATRPTVAAPRINTPFIPTVPRSFKAD